jgi:hypothetical protein
MFRAIAARSFSNLSLAMCIPLITDHRAG